MKEMESGGGPIPKKTGVSHYTPKNDVLVEFFYGDDIHIKRKAETITLSTEDHAEGSGRRYFATRKNKKTELAYHYFKLISGDKITTGEKSFVGVADNSSGGTDRSGVSFTMFENSEISLETKRRMINRIEVTNGLFSFSVDTQRFKGRIFSPLAEIKFPHRTGLFYLEVREDATFVSFPMGFLCPLQITNKTTRETLDMTPRETQNSLVVVKKDGFYRKYYSPPKYLKGVPPRIEAAMNRLVILRTGVGVTRPESILELLEKQKQSLTTFDINKMARESAETQISYLKQLLAQGNLPDKEVKRIEQEIEEYKEIKTKGIRPEEELRKEKEKSLKGISIVQAEMSKEFERQASTLDTPLPRYEDITEEDRVVPKKITRTMTGMEDILKLVDERDEALSRVESEEEKERIVEEYRNKEEEKLKTLTQIILDQSKGIGHLSAYTAKKDIDKSVSYRGLAIHFTYAEKGTEMPWLIHSPPKKEFLLLGVEITNKTKDQLFIFPERELRLLTEKKEEIEVRDFKIDQSFDPNTTYKGYMLFVVPEEDNRFEIRFKKSQQTVSTQIGF